MNPEQLKKALDAIEAGDSAAALEILKAMIASAAAGGEPPPEVEAAAETADPPAPKEEEMAAVAASRQIFEVLGAKTAGEATAKLASLVDRVKTLDADRASLDLSERQGLVAQLVIAGAETPATAWADAEKRQPKKRLMDEPIAELRERAKTLVAASKARGHVPPASTSTVGVDDGRAFKTTRGEIVLSSREIKNCEKQGADVNAYAENKAIRESARNRT